MSRTRICVGALALLAAACGEDEPRGWTRVVEMGPDEVYYSFVHADREADVCVTVDVRGATPGEIDDVLIKGANYVVRGARVDPYESSCTNAYDFYAAGSDSVTGKITFDDFINIEDADAPCTVSFELEVEDADGNRHEMSAKKFPILDVGCPRPRVYAVEYTQLDAAVGVYDGTDTIVLSTWDAAREVCVVARLSTDPALTDSEVETPDGWVYSGLRFDVIEQADCTAERFVHPPINPAYSSDAVGEHDSTGTVRFTSTDAAGWPCAMDVDLDLRSYGRYDWTPDDVHMLADAVPVVGACD